MIIDKTALTLSEVKDFVKDLEEKKDLKDYLKKFESQKKNGSGIIDKLKALDNIKIKEDHMIKIVDFMPRDSEDLNKIFTDVSLDEKESNEILEIVKGE